MKIPILLESICNTPVESYYRFQFWEWSVRRKLSATFHELHGGNLVHYYLSHIEDSNEANCLSAGQLGEIMRDVGRTFPEHPIFSRNGPGEIMLGNILKAIVSLRPDIGYCQGMNFVVGALLLGRLSAYIHFSDFLSIHSDFSTFPLEDKDQIESDVFWFTQRLLVNGAGNQVGDSGVFHMESIWSPGFPKMKLRVYQFDSLFKWNLPELYQHCESINLSTEVMVSQWFMTLFAYMFPLDFTHHIWDYIFLIGWPGVFKVTLALLFALSDKLMEMDLEQVGLMIRDWKRGKFSLSLTVAQVLQSAEKFNVTSDTLNALQEGYALEIIRAAMSSKADGKPSRLNSISDRPTMQLSSDVNVQDMSLMYKDLVDLELQVEKDKEVIQKKILVACEACENSFVTLNQAIQEETTWIEKTTEIKFELAKWSSRVTTLIAEIQGVDEAEGQIARPVQPEAYHEDPLAPMSNAEMTMNLTESGEENEEPNSDGGESSTIEEEHAQLAEEYEEEDYGYEDENESVSETQSSISHSSRTSENSLEISLPNRPPSFEMDDGLGDMMKQQHRQSASFENGISERSKSEDENITQDFVPEFHSRQSDNGFPIDLSTLSPQTSPQISPTSSQLNQANGFNSVVEKMKYNPNRRRVVGIVQNHQVPGRGPPISVVRSQYPSIPSSPEHSKHVDLFPDPSNIADNLLKRFQTEENSVLDLSLAQDISAEQNEKSFLFTNSNQGSDNSGGGHDIKDDDSGYSNDHERDTSSSFSTTKTSRGENSDSFSRVNERYHSESKGYSSSTFHFSTKLREGLDMIYRATAAPPSSQLSGKISATSDSLRALAEKERSRWVKKKDQSESNSLTNRLSLPKKGFSILSRERLLSRRIRAQLVKDCRKVQLKVAKLTRALDVARKKLRLATSNKMEALMADEESKQWKESLCHQFQLLVEDSTRCRSQKLLYIAETYGG